MKLNESKTSYVYANGSTSASIFLGTQSTAVESYSLNNALFILELIPEASPQLVDYANISKNNRELMKKIYPPPSVAKLPAIAKDLDIL